jgi:hypothetical protein
MEFCCQAVVEAHQVHRLSGAIRTYLQGDRWGDNSKIPPKPHPFYIVARSEEVNFTDVALDVLRQEVRADGAFQYVASRGTTAADYRALMELPRRDSFRDEALRTMRERLGLSEDGHPLVAK